MTLRLLLATGNPHKVAELAAILGAAYEVLPREPGVAETGGTYEENALLKARAVRDATGGLAVADDSGIEVDALGGAPGVRSARWADGTEAVVRGTVTGTVAAAPRGEGGFGYDPLVVPVEGDGRTFAELAAAEKHSISHRARAFRALTALLEPTGS